MNNQEFAGANGQQVGAPAYIAPHDQGGVYMPPSQPAPEMPPQIAEGQPPSAPPAQPPAGNAGKYDDPFYKELQQKADRAEARANQIAKQMEQIQRDQQLQSRRSEEQSLQQQLDAEWRAAPTPEAKRLVEQKYAALAAERRTTEAQQQAQMYQATAVVNELRYRLSTQAGIPRDVIEEALRTAGNDPRSQANALTLLPMEWLEFQRSQSAQPQLPQPQPGTAQYAQQPLPQQQYAQQQAYPQAPQYPPQAGAPQYAPQGQAPAPQYQAPQEPVRMPAQQVARPGTVTPAEPSLAAMRNQARMTGDWKAYQQAKQAKILDAKRREARGEFVQP